MSWLEYCCLPWQTHSKMQHSSKTIEDYFLLIKITNKQAADFNWMEVYFKFISIIFKCAFEDVCCEGNGCENSALWIPNIETLAWWISPVSWVRLTVWDCNWVQFMNIFPGQSSFLSWGLTVPWRITHRKLMCQAGYICISSARTQPYFHVKLRKSGPLHPVSIGNRFRVYNSPISHGLGSHVL